MNLIKKGQAELIGLVMFVVILVIILVIALNFSSTQPGNNDLRTSLTANNLLNAIIKANNNNLDIKELISGCYFGLKNGKSEEVSCGKLKNEFDKIIYLSLGNKNYQADFMDENNKFYIIGNCIKGIETTPYRFKKDVNTFVVNLKLC